MTIYKITSCLAIGDAQSLVKALFPAWDGHPMTYNQSEITVTFPTPQTPVDLGPLVKVEEVTEPTK